MNTTSHIHHGQWRRPDARQGEFSDVNLWIDLAKTLEEAKFDAMFFADVSGHYGDADATIDHYVEEGLQIPSNDPTVLLSALAVNTRHIGLATTSNVFQNHPFNFARQISTLDHISNGRIAWNIVTGTQDNGARNYGLENLTDHAERYRWAQEYVDVGYKLWEGSWDEGAVVYDKLGSRYSDPAKVHKIYHQGQRYSVEGPHLPAPSPQRTPLLFQAGSSASGRDFAARNAEATFIIAPSKEVAQQIIADTRRRAEEYGRNPEDIKFFVGLTFIIGDTFEEALAKEQEYEKYVSARGYLAHAAIVDPDGRVYAPEVPLKDVETNTAKGFAEWIAKDITDREPLVADLAQRMSRSQRIVGTPESIADELEGWAEAGVDGINVMNWVLPGSFEEFAEKLSPVLKERGLQQNDYRPGTLREKLFGSSHLNERHPAADYRGAFAPGGWAALENLQRQTEKSEVGELQLHNHESGEQDRLATLKQRFQPLFEQIAQGTLEREQQRILPYEQIRLLSESGFTALTVPREYGGENISIPELIELLVDLAEADPNLPQILHAHFAFTEIHRTNPQPISTWWLEKVGAGKIISNGMVAGQNIGGVEGEPGSLTFSGSKVYSTGALFSDYLFIVTGVTESGAPHMHVIPTHQSGIELVDDWDGIGQRLTGSGTTHFTKVPLDESKVLDIETPVGLLIGPLVFLIHAATQAGIATNAVSDAARYVSKRRRTYGHAAAELPKDDPQVQEVVGRAGAAAYAARAVVRQAAEDLAQNFELAKSHTAVASSEAQDNFAQALIAASQFASVVSDHAQEATTLLFEAGGATVLQSKYGFDRHWRNARVLASHNPAHFKLRSVGDYLINGTYPAADSYSRPVNENNTAHEVGVSK